MNKLSGLGHKTTHIRFPRITHDLHPKTDSRLVLTSADAEASHSQISKPIRFRSTSPQRETVNQQTHRDATSAKHRTPKVITEEIAFLFADHNATTLTESSRTHHYQMQAPALLPTASPRATAALLAPVRTSNPQSQITLLSSRRPICILRTGVLRNHVSLILKKVPPPLYFRKFVTPNSTGPNIDQSYILVISNINLSITVFNHIQYINTLSILQSVQLRT